MRGEDLGYVVMSIDGDLRRKCASCQLIGSMIPSTGEVCDSPAASDSLRDRILRVLEGHDPRQHSLPGHSSDYIEGTWASCRKTPGFIMAELRRQGVDRKTFKTVSIRQANVVWCGANRFEFTAKGRSLWTHYGDQAFIILVRDAFGRAVDIVACDPRNNRLSAWLGRAYAVGQDSVLAGRMSEGLLVHRTLLNYLRASGKGIVILNYEAARNYLADAGPLIAEDPKHRRELTAALTHPLPRILVSSAGTKEG